jgi:hypothetical protein
MGALAFFPWLRLPSDLKPIHAAGFELLRYAHDEYKEANAEAVGAVLAPYAEGARTPLREAVLLRVAGRDIVDDLDASQIEAAFQFAEMVALAGLSKRQFFSHSGYSNRDAYRLIIQKFDKPGKGSLQQSLRRDGVSSLYIMDPAYRVECPSHVSRLERVNIDEQLLQALVSCRKAANADDFIESTVTFNLANTDNPAIAQHVELVLSSGALEKVLGLHHGKEDQLANALSKCLRPHVDVAIKNSPRAAMAQGKSTSLRELWIRDLYRYRNEFAHGNVAAKRARIWNVREHLLLSSYVFPLVIKAQLAAAGFYTLTDDDHLEVDTFEPLLCAVDLFATNADGDFIWQEITERVRNAHRRKRTLAAIAKVFPKQPASSTVASKPVTRGAESARSSKRRPGKTH